MRLRYTRTARADLESIESFLKQQAGGSVAADQLERIRTAANRLRDYPGIGPRGGEHHRKLQVGGTPYLLIYRVEQEAVQIMRVFHGARDWPRLLD